MFSTRGGHRSPSIQRVGQVFVFQIRVGVRSGDGDCREFFGFLVFRSWWGRGSLQSWMVFCFSWRGRHKKGGGGISSPQPPGLGRRSGAGRVLLPEPEPGIGARPLRFAFQTGGPGIDSKPIPEVRGGPEGLPGPFPGGFQQGSIPALSALGLVPSPLSPGCPSPLPHSGRRGSVLVRQG